MNIQILRHDKVASIQKKTLRILKNGRSRSNSSNLKEKGPEQRRIQQSQQAVGGLDAMIDTHCKDQDTLALIQYAVDSEKDAKILENQQVLKTPIVRNGAKAPGSRS